jgi:hypothetical protein
LRNNLYKRGRHNRNTKFSKEGIIAYLYQIIEGTQGYKLILFTVLFLLPIYPSLSSFVYANNQYEFSRDDIDESSIL